MENAHKRFYPKCYVESKRDFRHPQTITANLTGLKFEFFAYPFEQLSYDVSVPQYSQCRIPVNTYTSCENSVGCLLTYTERTYRN